MHREPKFLQRLLKIRDSATTTLVLNLITLLTAAIFALYFTGPEPKWIYLTALLVFCGFAGLKIYLSEKKRK